MCKCVSILLKGRTVRCDLRGILFFCLNRGFSRMTRISRIFGRPSHQVYRSIKIRIPSTREMLTTLWKTHRKIEKYLKIQSETDENCPNFRAGKNVGIFPFSRRLHGDFYRYRRAVGSQNTIEVFSVKKQL